MKSFAAMCVVLLVSLVSSAAALKCFKCTDCDNSIVSEQKCLPAFDTCVKLSLGDRIGKFCNLKNACEALQEVDLAAARTALRGISRSGKRGLCDENRRMDEQAHDIVLTSIIGRNWLMTSKSKTSTLIPWRMLQEPFDQDSTPGADNLPEKDLKDMRVDCCQGDFCNSASTSFINPLLFLPTLMFFFRF